MSGDVYPGSTSSFPDFSEKKNWYNLPLLSRKGQPTTPIGYRTQERAIKAALDYAEVQTSKKTHASRIAGAQFAEAAGASVSEIARAGGWATAVMEVVYLSAFPREAMRALAGFPTKGGSFFLERALEVPDALQRKLFPESDKWSVPIGLAEINADAMT